MPTSPQNDPPPSRGGIWNRLWSPRLESKPEEPAVPGSSGDVEIPAELLAPIWDSETDTAHLHPVASPTEALEPSEVPLDTIPLPACPACSATLDEKETYCRECGLVLPKEKIELLPASIRVEPAPDWHERYKPEQPLPSRPSVQRWLALARQDKNPRQVEVYYSLKRSEVTEPEAATPEDEMVNLQAPLKQLHSGSAPLPVSAESLHWPGARWLHQMILKMPGKLPAIREYTEEESAEILVIDPPEGTLLWDAWDKSPSLVDRFRWLAEIAEMLQQLHQYNVVMEALRPEMFVVDAAGHIVLADLTELLPIPVPSTAQMKGALSTAPELVLAPELADASVDLYPFGALVYALHHGRELTDLDFDAYGVPRSFVSIFPDGHPLFTQVVLKTFTRFVEQRYPTQEDDPDQTGFTELIAQLRAGERSAQALRYDAVGWSSTGLARATNEDAFAVFHASAYEQDRWGDQTLVILADGMGGCNAGEVASALAISTIRRELCSRDPWKVFHDHDPSLPVAVEEEKILEMMHEAIETANSTIHTAAEQGDGTQIGMGCTCEVGFLMQGRLYMGHVGDSRTYLYREGAIRQLTQDQTLVNRLVSMGVINEEEAVNHPRRHELDQALGSSHPVQIQLISEPLQVGDALIFCSDGLTTHVNDRSISEVLRNTASAEAAARRLVNLANALGGSDNVTVVVVRVA